MGKPFSLAVISHAIPILFALVALASYSFLDWLRDRYFYLWGRPISPVELWGQEFTKLTLNSQPPSFIKSFLFAPVLQANPPNSAVAKLLVTTDTPDSFLWDASKFFGRCFPRNDLSDGISNSISHIITYFWYLTSNGKNIPIVCVSLSPIQDENTVWINIFNGCVAGLVRGLGYGPFYFVETVKKYVYDVCVDGDGRPVAENQVYFSYSVQLNYNPYAVHTCASYVSSGILRYLYIGALPHTPFDVRQTLSGIRSGSNRYSLTSLLEKDQLDDNFLQSLVLENDYDFYRDICMVGKFDVMKTEQHKFNPCSKRRAEDVCGKIINFMNGPIVRPE